MSTKVQHYIFFVLFTVCICFKFYFKPTIEYKILSDYEIHNWSGSIKEKITCSTTIQLKGLIKTLQKPLLQEYDKKESLLFDVDDINKVIGRVRLKVIGTSDKDIIWKKDRNSFQRRWKLVTILTLTH